MSTCETFATRVVWTRPNSLRKDWLLKHIRASYGCKCNQAAPVRALQLAVPWRFYCLYFLWWHLVESLLSNITSYCHMMEPNDGMCWFVPHEQLCHKETQSLAVEDTASKNTQLGKIALDDVTRGTARPILQTLPNNSGKSVVCDDTSVNMWTVGLLHESSESSMLTWKERKKNNFFTKCSIGSTVPLHIWTQLSQSTHCYDRKPGYKTAWFSSFLVLQMFNFFFLDKLESTWKVWKTFLHASRPKWGDGGLLWHDILDQSDIVHKQLHHPGCRLSGSSSVTGEQNSEILAWEPGTDIIYCV